MTRSPDLFLKYYEVLAENVLMDKRLGIMGWKDSRFLTNKRIPCPFVSHLT